VIRKEVGADAELTKQALAEFFALDRQHMHDHFEGRLEYARHVMTRRDTSDRGMVEYGLQTLKWSFLLNAGAIAVVMAYIGAAVGKSGAAVVAYAPLIRDLWPFVAGCVSVTLAGAAGYFNFCYSEAAMPGPEALNNFLSITATGWPEARLQKPGEPLHEFVRRFGWKVNASRMIAIVLGIGSAFLFLLGAALIMRAGLA
jgi:hypothetical protein